MVATRRIFRKQRMHRTDCCRLRSSGISARRSRASAYSAPQPLQQVAHVPACDARDQKKDRLRWKCSHRVDLIDPVLQTDHWITALIILKRSHHARLRPRAMINIAHTDRNVFLTDIIDIRTIRATLVSGTEPTDKRCQKTRIPGCAIRSVPRKTRMDTTTLLIIVLLVLLLGGGGWYGRGRWY
jgi:hypothetical protein